jgi:hypothetical protein
LTMRRNTWPASLSPSTSAASVAVTS